MFEPNSQEIMAKFLNYVVIKVFSEILFGRLQKMIKGKRLLKLFEIYEINNKFVFCTVAPFL